MVGRLVAYKGFELAVEAFNESGKPLVIIGGGPEFKKLEAKAKPNISLLGKVSEADLEFYMNNCKAFIFPGKEDFGIVMAEAQSAGKPVIALRAGGALDIVRDRETGVLYEANTAQGLNRAVRESESLPWDARAIEDYASQFDERHFKKRLQVILDDAANYTPPHPSERQSRLVALPTVPDLPEACAV
jgi:glycosyltransferase involved in cell wall biosynthesis